LEKDEVYGRADDPGGGNTQLLNPGREMDPHENRRWKREVM
jgi:hypothetical protein